MAEAGRTPPSEGGGGADAFPSSASRVHIPPLSPCSFLDNEGEGDTRGRLKSSFSVSPSTLGPSEGGREVGGGGAGDAALDLDAGVSGGLVVGPAWRLSIRTLIMKRFPLGQQLIMANVTHCCIGTFPTPTPNTHGVWISKNWRHARATFTAIKPRAKSRLETT